MDVNKQIEYWRTGAESDLETADILIGKGKLLHGLFWCHLVIEKILKAHYVQAVADFAPKTHNLIYLAEKSNLILENEQREFLGILLKYQLEGRYPEHIPKPPTAEIAGI